RLGKKTRRGPGRVGAAGDARSPCERTHYACGRDLADGAVVVVAHIDIARAVGGDAARASKARRGPGRVGAAGQVGRTGERGHYACGRDLADGAVAGVGHIDIARAVGGNAAWEIKARRGPGSVGASEQARSGERAHRACGRELADSVVVVAGYIDIARPV